MKALLLSVLASTIFSANLALANEGEKPAAVTLTAEAVLGLTWNSSQIIDDQTDGYWSCWNSVQIKSSFGNLNRYHRAFLSERTYTTQAAALKHCKEEPRLELHNFISTVSELGTLKTRVAINKTEVQPAVVVCYTIKLVVFLDWNEEGTQGRITDSRLHEQTAKCP